MNINYRWIGWCHEHNHDKVWGVIDLGHQDHIFVTFWGRRGKTLQTKRLEQTCYEIDRLIDSKKKKGYTQVDGEKLDTVYPEFDSDLQKTAVWAILCKK